MESGILSYETKMQQCMEVINDPSSSVPGGVGVIGHGGEVLSSFKAGFTSSTSQVEPDFDSIYDLASLTKVVATLPALLSLAERGDVDLEGKVGEYLPAARGKSVESLDLVSLLTHTSGLSGRTGLWASATTPDEAKEVVLSSRLVAQGSVEYSNRGFILLGMIVEEVSGLSLHEYVSANVWAPLGMKSTLFTPDAALRSRIVPTEVLDNGNTTWGEVHDENAKVLGGIAGHAGTFSSPSDLMKYCTFLTGSYLGKYRLPIGPDAIQSSMRNYTDNLSEHRGLGWAITYSEHGEKIFGHLGFTGTGVWLVPEKNLWAFLLTNRVHPSRNDPLTIRGLREIMVSGLEAAANHH